MLKLTKEVYPSLFAKAGPGCIRGNCPEGNMTCEDIERVRGKYKIDPKLGGQ